MGGWYDRNRTGSHWRDWVDLPRRTPIPPRPFYEKDDGCHIQVQRLRHTHMVDDKWYCCGDTGCLYRATGAAHAPPEEGWTRGVEGDLPNPMLRVVERR